MKSQKKKQNDNIRNIISFYGFIKTLYFTTILNKGLGLVLVFCCYQIHVYAPVFLHIDSYLHVLYM